jgi:hypothetical protein
MKLQRTILAALLIVAAIVPAVMTAKNVKMPKVYMFGFAASFNDTIVHFTDVQAVDSVWMDSKTHFLLGRENYSNMLRNYLDQQLQMPHRTCIVVANTKRAKLEKKFLKMKKLYTQSKDGKVHFDVKYLGNQDFEFKTIDMSGYYTPENTATEE